MAVITNRLSSTYSAQSRVINTTSNDGIAGLVVTVYDLFKVTDHAALDNLGALLKYATRVGSVLSDETGAFFLSYDKDDIAALHSEKPRLDLFVVVSAPDDE